MVRPRKTRIDFDVASLAPNSAHRELWVSVAETLRHAILSGSIRAGASLVEADLAARFEVSRGPIRDALRELAREGLVVDLPRRGTVVSTISFADLREVYEVREGLEIASARLAVERASEGDIKELAGRLRDLEDAWARDAEYGESLRLDLAFHRDLVQVSGNSRLVGMYGQMLVQTQLHAITAAEVNPRLRRGMKRPVHGDIVRALRRRDADAAARAVASHYLYARERLFAGYPRQTQIPED